MRTLLNLKWVYPTLSQWTICRSFLQKKIEKLENVIRKIYSQIGVIKENGLWMPVNPETKKTYGYCFIEYNTPQVVYFLVSCISLPCPLNETHSDGLMFILSKHTS